MNPLLERISIDPDICFGKPCIRETRIWDTARNPRYPFWPEGRCPMTFRFAHNNINVFDLGKSLAFYGEALGLKEVRRIASRDDSFVIVYLGDGATGHKLELTWLRDRTEPYNLGDNEIHLALTTDDYEAAHARHAAMGCICYENEAMGIYFIADPDGYWVEILPAGRG